MTVRDLVCGDTHDIGFDYKIFSGIWNDDGILLYDSKVLHEHLNRKILDAEIKYITIEIQTCQIIIEIEAGLNYS